MPFMTFERFELLLTEQLLHPECTDAMADLYPAIVIALQFLFSWR